MHFVPALIWYKNLLFYFEKSFQCRSVLLLGECGEMKREHEVLRLSFTVSQISEDAMSTRQQNFLLLSNK
jgi:hypothetical protein